MSRKFRIEKPLNFSMTRHVSLKEGTQYEERYCLVESDSIQADL